MGYIEKILGDNERVVYRTHLHWIVLLQRIASWFFVFLVFLGLGLAVIIPRLGEQDQIRWWVGLIVLISVILPVILIIRPWVRGERGRDYVKAIWRPALAALAILAVALVLMIRPDFWYMGLIGVVVALYPLAEVVRLFLDWMNERYLITNRRVMEVRGIINKHVRDSALEKVNDVDLNQSFVGRILNYGTVQIITGSDIGVNMFRRISNPVRFKRAMLNAKEELHRSVPSISAGEDLSRAAPPPAAEAVKAWADAVASADIPDLIRDLDELRQKGIISEEEFQAKKTELLNRL